MSEDGSPWRILDCADSVDQLRLSLSGFFPQYIQFAVLLFGGAADVDLPQSPDWLPCEETIPVPQSSALRAAASGRLVLLAFLRLNEDPLVVTVISQYANQSGVDAADLDDSNE